MTLGDALMVTGAIVLAIDALWPDVSWRNAGLASLVGFALVAVGAGYEAAKAGAYVRSMYGPSRADYARATIAAATEAASIGALEAAAATAAAAAATVTP